MNLNIDATVFEYIYLCLKIWLSSKNRVRTKLTILSKGEKCENDKYYFEFI